MNQMIWKRMHLVVSKRLPKVFSKKQPFATCLDSENWAFIELASKVFAFEKEDSMPFARSQPSIKAETRSKPQRSQSLEQPPCFSMAIHTMHGLQGCVHRACGKWSRFILQAVKLHQRPHGVLGFLVQNPGFEIVEVGRKNRRYLRMEHITEDKQSNFWKI